MRADAHPHLFHHGTDELLAVARDAYLQNALAPTDAQQVEQYLADHSVERSLALARYHELQSIRARQELPPLVPPAWLQTRLRRQVSVSGWGPLRRPIVQISLGTFLVLGGFSLVRWVQNKPFVPVPVQRTLNSAARSLGQPLIYPTLDSGRTSVPETPAAVAVARQTTRVTTRTIERRIGARRGPGQAVDSLTPAVLRSADSLLSAPQAVVPVENSTPEASVPNSHLVRGHVFDYQGRPLPGATVLVKGTARGVVTDRTGAYEVEAPIGAQLLVGYAGYNDAQLTASQATGLDVTLEPRDERTVRRRGARL